MAKKDLAVVAVTLALAAVVYVSTRLGAGGNTVTVQADGKVYGRYPLDEANEININGTNTLIIEDGCAYMSQASCPDKLCIHQGRIHDSSKSIVCLPNKIVVTVDKQSEIGVDAVSQ